MQALARLAAQPEAAPAQRINAAMAVALLVGHEEEGSPLLPITAELMQNLLTALQHSVGHSNYLGLYWTTWKLCQALSNLAVCDSNKLLMLQQGAVRQLAAALLGKHDKQALVTKYTIVTMWHLAFLPEAKEQVISRKDLMAHITALMHSPRHDETTIQAARGCLWTLGARLKDPHQAEARMHSASQAAGMQCGKPRAVRECTHAGPSSSLSTWCALGLTHQAGQARHSLDLSAMHNRLHREPLSRAAQPNTHLSQPIPSRHSSARGALLRKGETGLELSSAHKGGQHLMVSYEWGSQNKAIALKIALEKLNFRTWMDLEKMSGSTLEAMALAVEGAAAVLVCVSKRYKESQACRTEAEYAFQLRKKIIPVMMDSQYKPNGWLGALLGTKLYYDMSERRAIPGKVSQLTERELHELWPLVRLPELNMPEMHSERSGSNSTPRHGRVWASGDDSPPTPSSLTRAIRKSMDITGNSSHGQGYAHGALQPNSRPHHLTQRQEGRLRQSMDEEAGVGGLHVLTRCRTAVQETPDLARISEDLQSQGPATSTSRDTSLDQAASLRLSWGGTSSTGPTGSPGGGGEQQGWCASRGGPRTDPTRGGAPARATGMWFGRSGVPAVPSAEAVAAAVPAGALGTQGRVSQGVKRSSGDSAGSRGTSSEQAVTIDPVLLSLQSTLFSVGSRPQVLLTVGSGEAEKPPAQHTGARTAPVSPSSAAEVDWKAAPSVFAASAARARPMCVSQSQLVGPLPSYTSDHNTTLCSVMSHPLQLPCWEELTDAFAVPAAAPVPVPVPAAVPDTQRQIVRQTSRAGRVAFSSQCSISSQLQSQSMVKPILRNSEGSATGFRGLAPECLPVQRSITTDLAHSGYMPVGPGGDGQDWTDLAAEHWGVEQVGQWLVDVQLQPLVSLLVAKHKLDGRALSGLYRFSKQGQLRVCLKEDLGITSMGLMLAFVEELFRLFD